MTDREILNYETAINIALKQIKNRELIFWGDNAEFREYLKQTYDITVEKSVTTFEKKGNDSRMLLDNLKDKSDRYYIILPKDPPSASLKKRLSTLGFKEGKDYIFVKRTNTILPAGHGEYRDIYGNVIQTGGRKVILGKYW